MALDVTYLSTAYGIPESNVQTLIDEPTAELVKDFLSSVLTKAQEHDSLQADKLRGDVELENTVRTSEAKVKSQKAAAAKYVQEVEELRAKLGEAEGARESLSSELEQLRSTASGSTAETTSLRQRIKTLEASNRDAFALVESKTTEKDRVANELSEQHRKLLTLRREVGVLEERSQSLENAASSQKFKEQSLQQEIELLKRNNEWHACELQTRNQEHSKFRKERNARVATLQRELEDTTANLETAKRTESSLRQSLDDLQAKTNDAFSRIANLQEEAARKEQSWKTELEGSKRLAELQAQNAATHKARLEELRGQLEKVNEDAAEEIGQLRSEIETEHADKEQAEKRVAELELTVERLEQQQQASRPSTPMNNGSLHMSTPGRPGSPFAVAGSSRKSMHGKVMTNTELVTKNYELQKELETERNRTGKLSTAMDEMIENMENRGPELLEMRAEQERLEEEVLNFSRLLDDASSARDNNYKEAVRWQSEAESRAREGDILRQQLRDHCAQIKMLLVEIQSRDQGIEGMSGTERYELERAARGELDDEMQQESDTNQLISQRLVIFRDVNDLQEKNESLLRLTRVLGEQMEGEEARKQNAQSAANAQEAEELRAQVARYKDELQSTATQIDSYIKERDMFRRMLQHRGQLAPDANMQSMFGQSIAPATPQHNGAEAVPQTPRSKDTEDLNKVLREQQKFFDQFRNESVEDRKTLKNQVDALAREKGALQSDLAHWKSQKTLADERYQLLQSTLNAVRGENSELQKRSQQLAENAARQDLRTQQVAEELVEARSMADSLRNENANVKAEKDLWKRIENRLTEDNKGLLDERSRLNKHVADLQNLQNERELADSEARRKLHARGETLESELTETRKKLDQELEDNRKAALRREYEEGQSRTRIDDLVKSLGNTREELASVKTTRDQLQSRVDEMKIELRSAEEKAAALQPRPTPRAEPQGEGEEEELSTEQRLSVQATDLRRDLELSQNELEAARQQVEQYRSIAQGAEEELASFNETSGMYKEETDRHIEEKDAHARELQQRVDDLLAELTTTNNEISELRGKHEDSSRALDEQKANFQMEMSRLNDDADRRGEEKRALQEDLNYQAEIARQAQQSYENELVKHAEAAKNLQNARQEHNDLRIKVAGIQADADAARGSLESGTESWAEQREQFEAELGEVQKRRQDAEDQNRLLHQQMESFSSELSALRAGRSAAAGEGAERSGSPSSGDDNMQEVVKYLRREKEIVDVQYELSVQEAKRLQQQLDYVTGQLEDARQTLAEQRRQTADKSTSEGSHSKMMETLNELNLHRESAITLRNEARQAREKLEGKNQEVDRLVSEMEPMKGRVGELEGEVEGKNGEIKLLQDDRNHWRERTQNIISKYDRVDPAELEDLKKQLEELKSEKERLLSEQEPLQQQVDGIEQKVKEAVEQSSQSLSTRLENFKTQAKEQNRKQVAKIKDADMALELANSQKAKSDEELRAVKSEIERVKQELEQTKVVLQESQAKARAPSEAEEGQVDESENVPKVDEHAALHAKIAEAEAAASEHSGRADALSGEVQGLQARVHELEAQVATLQQQIDNIEKQQSAVTEQESNVQVVASSEAATLETVRQELATAQQEIESLRANVAPSAAPEQQDTGTSASGGENTIANAVAEKVNEMRQEFEQQHELAKKQLEEERDRRIKAMQDSLRDKLRTEREKNTKEREALTEQHSAELQQLKDEHQTAISKLNEAHKAELDRLNNDGSAAVQKAESAADSVKEEPAAAIEAFTEEQLLDAVKNSTRVRKIFANNVNKKVETATATHLQTIATKDEEIVTLTQEIATLKEAQNGTSGDATDNSAEIQALTAQLAEAEEKKQAAVRLAVENVEKKVKVQLSQRDMAQAKVAAVRKAAQETPEKPVKEVWDVADKTRPAPKPPAPSPAASTLTPGATPSAASKTSVPASPAQAEAQPAAQPAAAAAPEQTPGQTEQDKVQQRQERFGMGSVQGQPPSASTTTFGQPSAPQAGMQQPMPNFGSSTFGQPSQQSSSGIGSPGVPSPGPNPQAAAFMPNTSQGPNTQSRPSSQQSFGAGSGTSRGLPALRDGLPRPRGAPQGQQPARGGLQQSGIPAPGRGGSGIPMGNRGVRGGQGAQGRGGNGGNGASGQAHAGQKREHEGGHGGDGKRPRGGGGGGAGAPPGGNA